MRLTRYVLALFAIAAAIAVPVALGFSYSGGLSASDPTQTGALNLTLVGQTPSDCSTSKPNPGAADATTRNFDLYTFGNSGGTATCVTIQVDALGCSQSITSAAYVPSFKPTSITTNYVSDLGKAINLTTSPQSYYASVPAGQNLMVTVYNPTAGSYCTNYSLSVTGNNLVERPTGVGLTSAAARRSAHGVVVSWRAAQEVGVAGYNVYRAQGATRTRINNRLIAASAGLSAHTYLFVDTRPPARARQYWIQTVHLDGSRTWRGPLRVAARCSRHCSLQRCYLPTGDSLPGCPVFSLRRNRKAAPA